MGASADPRPPFPCIPCEPETHRQHTRRARHTRTCNAGDTGNIALAASCHLTPAPAALMTAAHESPGKHGRPAVRERAVDSPSPGTRCPRDRVHTCLSASPLAGRVPGRMRTGVLPSSGATSPGLRRAAPSSRLPAAWRDSRTLLPRHPPTSMWGPNSLRSTNGSGYEQRRRDHEPSVYRSGSYNSQSQDLATNDGQITVLNEFKTVPVREVKLRRGRLLRLASVTCLSAHGRSSRTRDPRRER